MKRHLRLAGTFLLPAFAIVSTGCLGYPTEGVVATPPAPGENAASRLPQLLSQLQGGGAGLELFDQPQGEVLAAQQEQQQGTSGTQTATPPNQKGHGSTATPSPSPSTTATPPADPPGGRPLEPGETPTPASATPTPTETALPDTPTPTPTPTPTLPPPTPTPTIPTEGENPPTEGD